MVILTPELRIKNIWIRWEFNIKDLWIGAYWDRSDYDLSIWICILPMLPIAIVIDQPYRSAYDNEDY